MAQDAQLQADFLAVFYLPGTLLHRGTIASDDAGEFAAACAHQESIGHAVINASKLTERYPLPWTLQALAAMIAEAEGVDVESLPSGRCAMVDPKTELAVGFITACPFNDALEGDHPLAGYALVATDEAELNWKHYHGAWLARMALLDKDGKVLGVKWLPPTTKEQGGARCYADSFAKPGEVLEHLKLVDHPTVGAEKF